MQGPGTGTEGSPRGSNVRLVDMHCHLDFAPNAAQVVAEAHRRGMGAFSNTVTPRSYQVLADGACATDGSKQTSVRIGCGLHPWWVADGSCGADDVDLFEDLVASTPFVGEVGLDFAPRRDGTRDAQLAAFERVMSACDGGGKLVSIHAVRSATAVLDVLERHRSCERNVCVIHWFSGASDELARAVRLGCRFSIGSRMLATKRGRAYVRAIPLERLLLETDLPDNPGETLDVDAWEGDLAQTLTMLEDAVGKPVGPIVAASSAELLRL